MHHTTTLADWMRDGPRLVREGVTSITFTDAKPKAVEPGEAIQASSDFVWRPDFIKMTCSEVSRLLQCVTYPTEQDARDALSSVAIEWAKQEEE